MVGLPVWCEVSRLGMIVERMGDGFVGCKGVGLSNKSYTYKISRLNKG